MEIATTLDIDSSVDDVWNAVRHFDGVARWVPGVIECTMKGFGPGAVRTIKMRDGMAIVERLESYDEAGKSFSYSIVKAPIPIKNYTSTISVASNGNAASATWKASAEPLGITEDQLGAILADICNGGLNALKTHCELHGTTQMKKFDPNKA